MGDSWSISWWFFSPIHVVWLRCYQFIFVDLELEIFFLCSFYHHYSLWIDLCRFGFRYLLSLFFISSPFQLSDKESPSSKEEKELMSRIPYASTLRCLMYAMVTTRPDLVYTIGATSRYISNPGNKQCEVVKPVPMQHREPIIDFWIGASDQSRGLHWFQLCQQH